MSTAGYSSANDSSLDQSHWFADVTAGIQQQEYFIAKQESVVGDMLSSYSAPNRAQGLRTYFGEDGIRIIPRNETTLSWIFGLEMTGFGRTSKVLPIPKATLVAIDNRIEYDHGILTEWFENRPEGIKQGFSIAASPPGEGDLIIEGVLQGDFVASLAQGGAAIDIFSKDGAHLLRYDSLTIIDALGARLPSRFEQNEQTIRIVFSDSDAAYPVSIDPLFRASTWTAEGNQNYAFFGYSLSSAGDVNGDGFDDVIVGARGYDNGQTDEGRAFVYYGSAGGLSATPSWTAESDQAGAYFGCSVSSAGDVNGDGFDDVIVGAYGYDNGQTDEGRAFVYYGSAGGLSATPSWTAESNQSIAYFGCSVSSAGDVNGDGFDDVIVGAYSYDNGVIVDGHVFVYYGSSGGLSTSAAWTAEGNQNYANFGYSVSSAGDVNGDGFDDVIVGAYGYDNGQTDEGRAFVYYGSAGGLSATPSWTAESDQAGAYFGCSVSSAGDVNGDGFDDVIVGAYCYANGQGVAFVYYGSLGGLSTSAAWTAEGNQNYAFFGYSVSSAGDVNGDGFDDVIVGAYGYDNGQTDEGRAFVYYGSSSGGLSSTGTSVTKRYLINFDKTGVPAGAMAYVTVNSVQHELPYSAEFESGTSINFEYESTVPGAAGIRYMLASVSHGSPLAISGPMTVTAQYKTQYNLLMSTSFGSVSPAAGSHWYDAGSTVTISATSPAAGAGERYVWNKWTGSGTVSYSGTNNLATVTMNSPITETASWTHQYELTMSTNFGTTAPAVGGSHWYDAGSTVTIQAFAPGVVTGEQYVWNGWTGTSTGSYTGTDNPATNAVAMNGPVTETASWTHQYLWTFDQTGLSSDAIGTVLTVNGVSKTYTDLPYSKWFDSGTPIFCRFTNRIQVDSGKEYELQSISPNPPWVVGGPVTLVVEYRVAYSVTFDQTGLSSDASGIVLTTWGGHWTYSTQSLPETYWLQTWETLLTYSYTPLIPAGPGKQYVLTGVTGPSSPVTVSDGPVSVIGIYKTQYYLTMSTNFGTVSPLSGWHDAGSTVTISATPPSTVAGERYVWNGWTGTGTGSYSGTDNLATVTMNSPITETASWTHQFELTMTTNFGTVSPATGWYDAGTVLTLNEEALWGPGEFYVWKGWTGSGTGSYSGIDGPYTVTMNSPITETASWVHYYRLDFVVSVYPGCPVPQYDWCLAGTTVYVTQASGTVSGGSGVQYVFTGWSGAATGTGLTSNPITMDGPKVAIADWKTQYYLTMSTNFGIISPGTGWCDAGSQVMISATAPTPGAGERYVWNGWTGSGTGSYSGIANPATDKVTMNGPITEMASWTHQYELTVTSDHDTPGGADWYDSGSLAYATLSSGTISGGAGIQYVFTGWSGDVAGVGLTSDSITMNAPKSATALWKTQFLLTVQTVPGGIDSPTGAGWYDAGVTAHVSVDQYVNIVSGESRYCFFCWVGGPHGTYADATVTMNNPWNAQADYLQQYYLTITTDPLGLDSPIGAGWHYPGPVHVSVDQYVEITPGESRYCFISWTGATGTFTDATVFLNAAKTVTASYVTLYYLTVTSAHGTPGGEGWYPADAQAFATLGSDTVSGGLGVQYVFTGWSGAATGTGLTSDPIMMNGLKVATAVWRTQYSFTMSIPNFGIVSPASDWYDVGTVLTISAEAPYAYPGEQYVFNGWMGIGTGSYSGILNPVDVTMNSPITETASWTHRFKLTMSTNLGTVSPGDGWHDEGSRVSIEATPPALAYPAGQERYIFGGWKGTGMGSYTGTVNPATGMVMIGPVTEVASWSHEYWLTVSSAHDNPSGAVWYPEGSSAHAILSMGTVIGGSGVRYVFTGWSGDASGTSLSSDPIVMNAPKTAIADWKTQYYLTMSTNFGTVCPATGWYDAGTLITISATSPSTIAGERYVWNKWTGSGTVSYSGTNNLATVTMNGPITETASWTHQYELTMATNFGITDPAVGGSHWYDAGSTVTISANAPTAGTGERYVWNGWIGSGLGSYGGMTASPSITMSGPISEAASWTHQYQLTMSTNYGTVSPSAGSRWYDAGTKVTISASAPALVYPTGERYVWNGWTGTGTGSYTGSDNPATNAVTMNGPITEAASWTHEYELTIATIPGGLDSPKGAGWYTAGTTAHVSIDQYVEVISGQSRYKFMSWTGASGTYADATVLMGAPKTATANYLLQHKVTLTYTGDTVVSTQTSSINLRATMEVLGSPTSTANAYITFKLSNFAGSPLCTYTGNKVTWSTTTVGYAVKGWSQLGEGTYLVVAALEANDYYYIDGDSEPALITVYEPTGSFVTGGGWIWDNGDHGNFGFVAHYNKNVLPKGSMVYVYRSGGYNWIVKSNSWIGLAISSDGHYATFQGKATVQKVDQYGTVVLSAGNYQFTVEVWDYTGTGTNNGVDVFHIKVLTNTGTLFKEAGAMPPSTAGNLQGGQIFVHAATKGTAASVGSHDPLAPGSLLMIAVILTILSQALRWPIHRIASARIPRGGRGLLQESRGSKTRTLKYPATFAQLEIQEPLG